MSSYPRLLTALAALLFAANVYAQKAPGAYRDSKQWPDTPEATRAREVIDLVNGNDPAKVRAYINENLAVPFRDAFPIDEHVQVFGNVFDRTRGIEFYGVRTYEGESPFKGLVAIVRSKLSGDWMGIVVEVEPAAPHRIAGLQFNPARPPSDQAPLPRLTTNTFVSELQTHLQRLADADAFSGTVLVAKGDEVLFEGAFGQACKSFQAPNTVDTKFNLGSMNKMFTGVAIAQLVQAGELSFDDPVSKYLSTDWLAAEAADQIRIKHLLTHTSGLGSYFNDAFMEASRERFRTINDYKPLVAESKLAFEPGTKWDYSNTGFLLAGAVIEKVTGGSYFDHIREHIYKPAAMTNSDSYDMDDPVPNVAIGYTKQRVDGKDVWRTNVFKHVIKGGPAGGGYSTTRDLFRFAQALRANKLLSAEMTATLLSAKPEVGSPDYGYGFGISGTPDHRVVGHNGGFPGISASLSIHMDDNFTVVVLSNYDRIAGAIDRKIGELIGRLDR